MNEQQFVQWVRAVPDLSSALRRLRELQRLTLQEVADLAGLSKAYVARIEYGERMPERDTLIALLLASYSLPVRQANRLLLLAGYAPMHHKAIARAV
jgi:transcriptional regulator with XRE-family HTH domain